MNLTFNQKIAFAVALFSFLAAGGSAADLVILFGSTVAKTIAAAASILAGVGGIFLGVVTGQGNMLKDVQAMRGVDSIIVNKTANPTLAALAVDQSQDKIEAAPGALPTLTETAKGV